MVWMCFQGNENDIYFLAHEMKSPLNNINCAIQILENLYFDSLNDDVIKYINLIKRNATIQDHLIDYVLNNKNGIDVHEKFDIVAITKDYISSFCSKAEMKQIGLIFRSNMVKYLINVDMNNYKRILNNLVSNALSFSPVNSKIIVELFCCNTHLSFSVSDEGPGISKDDMDKIFHKNWSKRDETDALYGNGFGLTFVKSIAENMGGSVIVRNRIPKGVEFTVRIPVPSENL